MACTSRTTGEHSRRIAERDRLDERDGQDEVGIQSVHVAPFSHVSRFTRHSLWRWRTFSASCYSSQAFACGRVWSLLDYGTPGNGEAVAHIDSQKRSPHDTRANRHDERHAID